VSAIVSAPTQHFDPDHAREIAATFDLRRLPSTFYDDPFPYYQALREHDPVRHMPDGSYFLTRYADVDAVYHDTRTFSSDKKLEFGAKYGNSPLFEHHTTSLVFNDPPLHTRVRRIIGGALTPRAIADRESDIVALVDRLLAAMAAKGDVDLVIDFAAAIPVEVIGNLLAIPIAEREPLRDWSLAILGALEPALSGEAEERGNRAVREFLAYLSGLVADRRAHPGDRDRDVLTRLVLGGAGGDQLLEHELLHNCIFILNAGHETTTNLIANSLHALTLWPEQRRRLQGDPVLIKTAVEEFLRFESSNQLGNRITTTDATIGSKAMPAGTLITLGIGAANRDPAQFPDPDRLDVARSPNRHLAFGSGAHQCVGMSLARLEGQVAISRFLARFPNYKLVGNPVRASRARFRGFLSVPARVG
jgi:cytochrome P450